MLTSIAYVDMIMVMSKSSTRELASVFAKHKNVKTRQIANLTKSSFANL